MLLLSSPTRSQRCGVLNHLLLVSAVPAQSSHYHQFPWTSGRTNRSGKGDRPGFVSHPKARVGLNHLNINIFLLQM